jgi:hypothetical protein
MKTKLPIMLMIVFLLCLTGCKSEIDKCVDANMDYYYTYKKEHPDAISPEKAKATWQLECLRAQAGK